MQTGSPQLSAVHEKLGQENVKFSRSGIHLDVQDIPVGGYLNLHSKIKENSPHPSVCMEANECALCQKAESLKGGDPLLFTARSSESDLSSAETSTLVLLKVP